MELARERGSYSERWATYAAFLLRSAQRFFIASPIRLLAAADSFLFRPSGLPDRVSLTVCFLLRAAIALLRRSRSASSSAMIEAVSKGVIPSEFGLRAVRIVYESWYKHRVAPY